MTAVFVRVVRVIMVLVPMVMTVVLVVMIKLLINCELRQPVFQVGIPFMTFLSVTLIKRSAENYHSLKTIYTNRCVAHQTIG